jgi:hypothetical protein
LIVEAQAVRRTRGRLELAWNLAGDLTRLRIPASGPFERRDELWRATCFEAFIQAEAAAGYIEINVAPSRAWAAYAFNDRRQGMRRLELDPEPVLTRVDTASRLEMRAILDLSPALPAKLAWRVGLTAVLETGNGGISYWALAHPPGKPDFHAPEGFVLTLTESS